MELDQPRFLIKSESQEDNTFTHASLLTQNVTPLNNRYHIAATSDNTRRAYQADIRHYENWGGQLPATTDGSNYIFALFPYFAL